jgi:hypothetical protein
MNLYKIYYTQWDGGELHFSGTESIFKKFILGNDQRDAAVKLRHFFWPRSIEIAGISLLHVVDIV